MKVLFLTLIFSLFSQNAFAAEVPQLHCDPETHVENSWLLMVNVDNQATSKESIMRSLMLVSGNGFSIRESMGGNIGLLMLWVEFDSKYVGDPVHAAKIRTDVVTELVGIRGNILQCNAINGPYPSIGGGN